MKTKCITDTGPVRDSNQDFCACGQFSSDSSWVIVCDGMGGASGGNIASVLATEKLKEIITSEFTEEMSKENIKAMMINAVSRANEAVYARSLEKEELHGMGTTTVVMIATHGTLHVVHVGDSRAYIKNKEGLVQITMDHSYVQNLVNFGQITKKEARVHPRRNIITRSLGVREDVVCDYNSLDFQAGDVALACSDGLSNYIEDELLSEYIDRYRESIDNLAEELVGYAAKSGGSDNITVAVIENE